MEKTNVMNSNTSKETTGNASIFLPVVSYMILNLIRNSVQYL
jgi:hypothetical protein